MEDIIRLDDRLEIPLYTIEQLDLVTKYVRNEWSIVGVQYSENSNPSMTIILEKDGRCN
jgi:hypothetical protein